MGILSIQSHVSFGHVGNAAAVFPLQRMGCDVWPVHTVMFSNHTGYGEWKGQVFDASSVSSVIEGMGDRGVLSSCDAVLSGYMGDRSIGGAIMETVARVRRENPDALYCCDPVMGDVGRDVFVRPDIPDFMRESAVPAADIVTPNQFEAQLLTGVGISQLSDALTAADRIRAMGCPIVLITSLERQETPGSAIEMLAVSADGAWLVSTPRINFDIAPNGSGDVTAALFLAHYLKGRDVALALENTANSVFGLFDRTAREGSRELSLIAAQDEFVNPSFRFRAERVRESSPVYKAAD